MNCECVERIEKKLVTHYQPHAGDNVQAEIPTATVITDTGLYQALQIEARVHGSKTGFKAQSGKKVGINATFCPFCARPAGPGRYREGRDLGIEQALGLAL